MSEEKVRRRGRPRLPAEQGKRHPIAIRTTKELKERLERASAASGRSLAQEMEFRLERSFEVQDVADVFYPLFARIADQIGELLRKMAKVPGADALQAKGLREFAAESDGLTRQGRSEMAANMSRLLDKASRKIASRAVPLQEEQIELQRLAHCRQDVEAFGRSELSLLDLLGRQPGLFNRGSAARPAHGESQEHYGILSGLCGGKASAARLRAGAAAERTDCERRGSGER